jgi:hypothetical protein
MKRPLVVPAAEMNWSWVPKAAAKQCSQHLLQQLQNNVLLLGAAAVAAQAGVLGQLLLVLLVVRRRCCSAGPVPLLARTSQSAPQNQESCQHLQMNIR